MRTCACFTHNRMLIFFEIFLFLFCTGSYDGQVYKRMFEAAEQSELNQNDVQPAFEKYLKPIMKSNL